jgi:superfamily I DNA and/or RNA helicase
MESKNSEVLKSLINLPQILKKNTELVSTIQNQIDSNNKLMGNTLTKYTETLNIIKDVKENIKIEELKEVNKSFNSSISTLKTDLNNVIIDQVIKKFNSNIDPQLKRIEEQNRELLKNIDALNSQTLELKKTIEIHRKFLEIDTFKEVKNRTFNLIVMFILSIFGLYFYLSPQIESPFLKTAIIFICSLGLIITVVDWIYCLIAYFYTERE